VIRLTIAWQPVPTLLEKIIPDDTLYGYSIARHIALGQGITYNGIDKTNGYILVWSNKWISFNISVKKISQYDYWAN